MSNPPPQRYWFSPNPFLRKMELFSVVPLLLSLAASGLVCTLFCTLFWHAHTFYHDIDRLGHVMCMALIATLSLLFFVIASIFTLVGFFHLDYPNSPKGLVSKILYRSAATLALPQFLFLLLIYFCC